MNDFIILVLEDHFFDEMLKTQFGDLQKVHEMLFVIGKMENFIDPLLGFGEKDFSIILLLFLLVFESLAVFLYHQH